MAQQIQELVASIRKEGIEVAKKEAAQVLEDAEVQAKKIIADAQAQAAKLTHEAEAKIALAKQSAEAALTQAGRDLLLSLKGEIEAQFERLLVEKTAKALSSKDLITLITKALEASDGTGSVELDEKTLTALGDELHSALASELKAGLALKAHEDVESGFRLVAKDGSFFYDYKASELAALLQPYLARTLFERVF